MQASPAWLARSRVGCADTTPAEGASRPQQAEPGRLLPGRTDTPLAGPDRQAGFCPAGARSSLQPRIGRASSPCRPSPLSSGKQPRLAGVGACVPGSSPTRTGCCAEPALLPHTGATAKHTTKINLTLRLPGPDRPCHPTLRSSGRSPSPSRTGRSTAQPLQSAPPEAPSHAPGPTRVFGPRKRVSPPLARPSPGARARVPNNFPSSRRGRPRDREHRAGRSAGEGTQNTTRCRPPGSLWLAAALLTLRVGRCGHAAGAVCRRLHGPSRCAGGSVGPACAPEVRSAARACGHRPGSLETTRVLGRIFGAVCSGRHGRFGMGGGRRVSGADPPSVGSQAPRAHQ